MPNVLVNEAMRVVLAPDYGSITSAGRGRKGECRAGSVAAAADLDLLQAAE